MSVGRRTRGSSEVDDAKSRTPIGEAASGSADRRVVGNDGSLTPLPPLTEAV